MRDVKGGFSKRLAGLLAFAYESLVLFFLLNAVLGYMVHFGGWFNYFAVSLILSCPLMGVYIFRRASRKRVPA